MRVWQSVCSRASFGACNSTQAEKQFPKEAVCAPPLFVQRMAARRCHAVVECMAIVVCTGSTKASCVFSEHYKLSHIVPSNRFQDTLGIEFASALTAFLH